MTTRRSARGTAQQMRETYQLALYHSSFGYAGQASIRLASGYKAANARTAAAPCLNTERVQELPATTKDAIKLHTQTKLCLDGLGAAQDSSTGPQEHLTHLLPSNFISYVWINIAGAAVALRGEASPTVPTRSA